MFNVIFRTLIRAGFTPLQRCSRCILQPSPPVDWVKSCGCDCTSVGMPHLDSNEMNNTRILIFVLNKSRKQHPTKQRLHGHLLPILQTIQERRTRLVRQRWSSRDTLKSNVHLWSQTHEFKNVGRPVRTCMHKLCVDIGCSLEDHKGAMDDIRIYIYIYILFKQVLLKTTELSFLGPMFFL